MAPEERLREKRHSRPVPRAQRPLSTAHPAAGAPKTSPASRTLALHPTSKGLGSSFSGFSVVPRTEPRAF